MEPTYSSVVDQIPRGSFRANLIISARLAWDWLTKPRACSKQSDERERLDREDLNRPC